MLQVISQKNKIRLAMMKIEEILTILTISIGHWTDLQQAR